MAYAYTPIFRSILTSTVWLEPPHVKVVWWTLLLLSDRNGVVEGSVPGLARTAVVTRDECDDAIARLIAPDPDSRSKENNGRRIVPIDGGWRILNHQKYKDKLGMSSESVRERVKRFRTKAKSGPGDVTPETDCNGQCNDLDLDLLDQELDQNQDLDTKDQGKNNKKKRSPQPLTSPPELLEPSKATLAVAESLSRNWQSDWDECRDWAIGKGELKADWQATLRNWMRRAGPAKPTPKPRTPCPDRIAFTEKHYGLCKRASLDPNLEWSDCRGKARSANRMSYDWSAEFESHLVRRISWLERDAAIKANGPQSAKTPPVTRPRPVPATVPANDLPECPTGEDGLIDVSDLLPSILDGIG